MVCDEVDIWVCTVVECLLYFCLSLHKMVIVLEIGFIQRLFDYCKGNISKWNGSFPFLGKIEQRGIQYFIHDHNTKSMFKLEGEQDFSPFADKKVLIVGFVIGSHDIRVLRIIELQ